MSNENQIVEKETISINNVTKDWSKICEVKIGVLCGSKLGPLLYFAFNNDTNHSNCKTLVVSEKNNSKGFRKFQTLFRNT